MKYPGNIIRPHILLRIIDTIDPVISVEADEAVYAATIQPLYYFYIIKDFIETSLSSHVS